MWKSFSPITRFSILVFLVSMALGLLSMGVTGYGLYCLVKPVLGNRIDELSGDVFWPSTLLAGMAWSFGFLIAASFFSLTAKARFPAILSWLIYIASLWLWALLVWYSLIEFRIVR